MKISLEEVVWQLPLSALMLMLRLHNFAISGGKGICLSDIEMIDKQLAISNHKV